MLYRAAYYTATAPRAGVFCLKPMIKHEHKLIDIFSMFQAEILAIKMTEETVKELCHILTGKITIYVVSQAELKAIKPGAFKWRATLDCNKPPHRNT